MNYCISLFVYLSFLVGCHSTAMYTTKITSEPPGARIEVNNDYIGDTPLEMNWEGYTENDSFASNYTVRALPRAPGQEVQVKTFNWWYDKIPKHIFFDMNLISNQPKKYEIDIK